MQDLITLLRTVNSLQHINLFIYGIFHLLFFQRLKHSTYRSDQIRSVAQLCPTLCDPVNRSTPGLHVQHQESGSTTDGQKLELVLFSPATCWPFPSPPASPGCWRCPHDTQNSFWGGTLPIRGKAWMTSSASY